MAKTPYNINRSIYLGKITGPVQNNPTGSKKITFATEDTYVETNLEAEISASVEVELKDGSLNNSATAGVQYTENEDAATVIPAEGALYINEGWLPNTKITLGHLIPDGAEDNAGVAEIRSGYEAYDTNGKQLIGTMADVDPKFTGGDVTIDGGTLTPTNAEAKIESTGTFKTATAYGVTPNQPSGTDGTNYLTIDGTISKVSDGSVSGSVTAKRDAVTYSQNTTGYLNKTGGSEALAEYNTTSLTLSGTVDVTTTDNFTPLYIPIVEPAFDGGDLNVSAEVNVTNPSIILATSASSTASNYNLTTTVPASGTEGTDYLKVSATKATSNGSATADASATSNDVLYNGAVKGAVSVNDNETALPGKSENATQVSTPITTTVTDTNFKDYYIPIVTPQFKGGVLDQHLAASTYNNQATVTSNATATAPTNDSISNYGITTTESSTPSGNIIFGASGNVEEGDITLSGTISSSPIKYDGNFKGAVNLVDDTTITQPESIELTETFPTQTFTKSGEKYQIPIVDRVTFNGGDVTATASGKVASKTQPSLTKETNATVNGVIGVVGTYGLGTSQPTGKYLKISSTIKNVTDGSVTVTAKADASTDGVTYTNNAGAIKAHNDANAIAAKNATQATTDITGNVTISENGSFTDYYMPITNVGVGTKSGDVTVKDNSTTVKTAPQVELGTVGKTSTGILIDSSKLSNYGITYTTPGTTATGDVWVFSTENSKTDGEYTVSQTVKRDDVSYTNNAGALESHTNEVLVTSKDYSLNDVTVNTNITIVNTRLKDIQIQQGSVSLTKNNVSITTKPKADADLSVTNAVTYIDNTSLGNKYITLTSSVTPADGSVTATCEGTQSKGIINDNQFTLSSDTTPIKIDAGNNVVKYMKVFDPTATGAVVVS